LLLFYITIHAIEIIIYNKNITGPYSEATYKTSYGNTHPVAFVYSQRQKIRSMTAITTKPFVMASPGRSRVPGPGSWVPGFSSPRFEINQLWYRQKLYCFVPVVMFNLFPSSFMTEMCSYCPDGDRVVLCAEDYNPAWWHDVAMGRGTALFIRHWGMTEHIIFYVVLLQCI